MLIVLRCRRPSAGGDDDVPILDYRLGMIIRAESPADSPAIRSLVTLAFQDAARSDGNEAAIVDALRADGVLTVSLVAEDDGEIVGHIAFSPITVNKRNVGWFGLGPVAVSPGKRRRGIGAALVGAGLKRLAELGAKGCVVLGDPAYYRRFGFESDPSLRFADVPPGYFQRRVIDGEPPQGVVDYAAAFFVG